MNTSHNKDRIIENGWKNVIKNTFGIVFEFVGVFKFTNLNIFRHTTVREIKSEDNEVKDYTKDNEIFTVTKTYNDSKPGDNVLKDDTKDSEIFTVTKTYNDNKPITSRNFNTLHCPTETEVVPSPEMELVKEFFSTQLFSHSDTLKCESYEMIKSKCWKSKRVVKSGGLKEQKLEG